MPSSNYRKLATKLRDGAAPAQGADHDLEDEYNGLLSPLCSAARRTLEALKYYLNRETIGKDFSAIPVFEWSRDGEARQVFPLKVWSSISFSENLEVKDHAHDIQEYLNRNQRPFLAMRHLHRAMRESSPRHKWIDATIAAELAAKEFFIRLKPDLETMLVELPSPSLDKLYGRLLKHYAGEKSPALQSLRDGMATRNKLTFDAAMAILSVHHWEDPQAGLAEMRRVARRQVVFTFDPNCQAGLWLVRDYLPEILELEQARAISIEQIVDCLPGARVEVVPIPWDCLDGFQGAYWRRPESYLDPEVRSCISTFAQLPQDIVTRATRQLAADLADGT